MQFVTVVASAVNVGFPSTREEALRRLDEFAPIAGRYASSRNDVLAGHPHVSRLSPAIRARLLLEDEVAAVVMAQHKPESVEKFVQEVYWRSYWKSWLELRPQIWHAWRNGVVRATQQLNAVHEARVRAIEAGQSGVAVMDAFARELVDTGYLHNHARMWLAGWWIHTERLPWELGAAFFLRHLLDGDAASNTLSWRWVAGLQTQGKTYLTRRSNVERYCPAARGDLASGLDALEDARVEPLEICDVTDRTPHPVDAAVNCDGVNASRIGLCVHEDDLCIERSPITDLRIESLAILRVAGDRSEGVRKYRDAALNDGAARAARHYGVPPEDIHTDEEAAFRNWISGKQLDGVVLLRPFVGPVRDAWEILSLTLPPGVCSFEIARPEDAARFPFARRGFFDFWKRLRSEILAMPTGSRPGDA